MLSWRRELPWVLASLLLPLLFLAGTAAILPDPPARDGRASCPHCGGVVPHDAEATRRASAHSAP